MSARKCLRLGGGGDPRMSLFVCFKVITTTTEDECSGFIKISVAR